MTDFQTVIGLVLAAFVLVGVPYLLALPRKRVEPEDDESEPFHRRFEQ